MSNCNTSAELLQAYKYYHDKYLNLTGTVPEAKGCNPTPPSGSCVASYAKAAALKKEKDMYNERNTAISVNPSIRIEPAQTFNAIETAQDHLIERLSEATESKIQAAKAAKGMINEERPRTAQSFIDRIMAGRFVIPEDRKNAYSYDPTDYIIWRDPKIVKDEPGFEAAAATINTDSDDVMDTIIVNGNEAGLTAIKAFKAKTYN